jgi:hypothetical protein
VELIWKLKLQDTDNKGRRFGLVLMKARHALGMITISRDDYVSLCQSIVRFTRVRVCEVVKKTLHERIYADAISIIGDPERAAKKLTELGWNDEKIQQYADELAINITQIIIDNLPEHL